MANTISGDKNDYRRFAWIIEEAEQLCDMPLPSTDDLVGINVIQLMSRYSLAKSALLLEVVLSRTADAYDTLGRLTQQRAQKVFFLLMRREIAILKLFALSKFHKQHGSTCDLTVFDLIFLKDRQRAIYLLLQALPEAPNHLALLKNENISFLIALDVAQHLISRNDPAFSLLDFIVQKIPQSNVSSLHNEAKYGRPGMTTLCPRHVFGFENIFALFRRPLPSFSAKTAAIVSKFGKFANSLPKVTILRGTRLFAHPSLKSRLRRACGRRNIKFFDVANLLSITPEVLSRILSGNSEIDPDLAEKIDALLANDWPE